MNILILDVGTSSMRGSLYCDDLTKIFSRQIQYCPESNERGEMRQRAADFEKALTEIMREVVKYAAKTGREIDAVSLTAQRSSVIPVDEKGRPLMDVIMWQDTRNREICGELEKQNDRIAALSGALVNTVFSGGKMAWIRREKPEIYQRVFKLVNIPEYLLHLMTGRYVTDYTYGSRTNLMNLRECRWEPELLEIFEVQREHLCELLPPGSVCGDISEDFALKTGIRRGVPVITAGGDQQCAAVGQGVFGEGKMSIVTGTGAFLVAASDSVPVKPLRGMIVNCSAIAGKYILETNILACCSAFDWFCRNFYGEPVDYDKVNKELEAVYGKEEGCMVLPYFQGRSTPRWNARAMASFHNITLGVTRADLLKAVLEGIFLEVKNNMDLLKNYVEIDDVYISGGLTKSRIICQMQADIYGLTLRRLEDTEATARGALMVTLHSLGRYGTYEEMFEMVCAGNKAEWTIPQKPAAYYKDKQREMNLLYEKIYQ